MQNKDKAMMMVERAIEHEMRCQCSAHRNGRRINEEEIEALRLLFSTGEGFQLIFGIAGGLIAENEDLREQFNDYVINWITNGPVFGKKQNVN